MGVGGAAMVFLVGWGGGLHCWIGWGGGGYVTLTVTIDMLNVLVEVC